MSKILIIKLGAKGDVVRTIPLAVALKRKTDGEIVWITKESNRQVLEGNESIDKIVGIEDFDSSEEFDALYNFDIEKEACEIAQRVKAGRKYGFYLEEGFAQAFNVGAEYYLNTLFDDDLKKGNRKTYQEMMFEAAEIPYEKERFELFPNSEDLKKAEKFIADKGLSEKRIVGIHLGASDRWPSKVWHPDSVKEFIGKLKEKGLGVILFGGPTEIDRLKKIGEDLEVVINNPENTDSEFMALVSQTEIMVCSDSFSLHVSLGLGKKTLGLFFCTTPHEIEGYELLSKITSPMLSEFFPERMDEYSEELVKSISAEEVFKEVEKVLN